MLEQRFDDGRLLAGADEVGRGTAAKEQPDRFDENGFAGPGLSGQDVQARVELDLDGIDHRQSPDPQKAEHRKEKNSNPSIGLTAIFTPCYSSAHSSRRLPPGARRPQSGAVV